MELESDGSVMADVANVAMSVLSSGTVSGVQFEAVFQSLLVGVALHVALSAEADWQITQSKMPGKKDQKRFLERIPRFSESKGREVKPKQVPGRRSFTEKDDVNDVEKSVETDRDRDRGNHARGRRGSAPGGAALHGQAAVAIVPGRLRQANVRCSGSALESPSPARLIWSTERSEIPELTPVSPI